MIFSLPKKFVTKVIDKYFLTDNERFLMVKLELTQENNTLVFLAGQYVSIKINEQNERRSYSIANTPDNDHGISIVAELLPTGKGSSFLRELGIGDEVEVVAPLGKFVVNSEDRGGKLFVATGSGIVPIFSMINDLLINQKENGQIRLHWGMRNEEDLFWLPNIMRLAEAHSNFVFDVVLSQANEGWKLCRGHVQDCLSRDLGGGVLDGWSGYICGNPQMIEEVKDSLIKLGMTEEKIHYEKFS